MEIPKRCKKAIESNKCLDCVGLAEKDWIPPSKCPYLPTAEESIKEIHRILGMKGEQIQI